MNESNGLIMADRSSTQDEPDIIRNKLIKSINKSEINNDAIRPQTTEPYGLNPRTDSEVGVFFRPGTVDNEQ